MKYKLKALTILTSAILVSSSMVSAQDKLNFVFTKKQNDLRSEEIAKSAKDIKDKNRAIENARIAADNKKTTDQLLVNEVKPYNSGLLLNISSAAESNSGSEAAKYKGGGTFDVNVRTGGFDLSVPFKKFANIDFSVSKTTSSSLSNKSYFGLPEGLLFKGLPFIFIENGAKVLSYNGSNNYIDKNYTSVDLSNRYIRSGLRYQATNTFTYNEKKGSLNVKGESIDYTSSLDFINGNRFFFNYAGLMVAETDSFFINGQDQNYKHISRLYYKDMSSAPGHNRLVKVVDATQQVLNFKYDPLKTTIIYPKNVNGKSPEMVIFMNMILTKFSATNYVGMSFSSDFNNLLSSISDVVTNNDFKIIKENKIYQPSYGVRNGFPVTTALRVSNANNKNESITTYYSYLGDSNNGFNYGHDTTIDQGLQSPAFYKKIKYATTVSVGNMQTKHYFTYLHSEIKTISSAIIDNKRQIISEKINNFNPVLNKNGVGLLEATYQIPTTSETIIYEKGVPVAKTKVDIVYNAYNLVTSQKNYKTVPYDSDFGDPITTKKIIYNPIHMIATKSIKTDNVTGSQVIENITLDNNSLLPIEKDVIVSNIKTGEEKEMPKQFTTYQTDTTGSGDYHVAGLPATKTITDGVNSITKKYEYYYDQQQNKLTTVEIDGFGNRSETVSIDGDIVKKTDNLGLSTTFKFYDNGLPLSKTDHLGNTETTQIVLLPDPKYKSQTLSIKTDILGNKTIKGYNWLKKEVFSSIPNGEKTSYSEGREFFTFTNDYPEKIKAVDKYGNYQKYFYDDLHRVNKVENYSASGNLMNTSNVSQSNTCDPSYGCYAKVIKDDGAGGVVTQYVRNKKVLFEQTVVDNKIIKKISYDYGYTGELESATTYNPNNPDNILTTSTYGYDVFGNKTNIYTYISGMKFNKKFYFNYWVDKPTYSQYFVNGQLIHTSYVLSYNKYGDVKAIGYKVGNGFRWTKSTFDKYQRPLVVTDYNGNVLTNSYNKYGKIKSKVFAYPSGKIDENTNVYYTYDNYGRQLSISNLSDTITLLYTPMGAQLGEKHTANGGYQSTMLLNEKNDPGAFTDALGNSYKYNYDKSGRPVRVDSNLGTIQYKYDDSNPNPRKRNKMIEEDTHFINSNFKNNLTKSLPTKNFIEGNLKKVWVYNNNGQQESLTTSDDNGNSLKVEYVYDNRQDIIKKNVTDISPKDTLKTIYNYSYDDRNRLLASSEFAINSIVNGDTSTQKRLFQYAYDDNGNIIHEVDRVENKNGIHQTVSDFTYSDKIDDQLVKMVKHVDGKITTTTVKYDLNGNMISTNES